MNATSAYWEHFEHSADIGVRGVGRSPAEAFEQAALALTAIVTDPDSVAARTRVPIECQEADLELLFVDWLNAVIYEMATRQLLFARYTVRIDGPLLKAEAQGEPIELQRHRPVVEIKGATYTELKVQQRPDGLWIAQCVVDV